MATRYILLFIVECKSYSSHKVPVADVEEFYAKVSQVAGLHVKGVFITDNRFQEGAYKYGKAKGMMLIQENTNGSFDTILHKTERKILNENSIEELNTDNNS